jgi:predicted small lipoprotein YifL
VRLRSATVARAAFAQATVALAVLGGLTACGETGGVKTPRPPPTVVAPVDTGVIGPVLELMSSLLQGDPARQAELFQQAKDAAELSPTTSNRLRYALALATPGHSGADPVAAQRQLSELLARPETLLPIERKLATVELKEVEQQLVLLADAKRLRDEDAARDTHGDKLATINRRLAAETDENARLRKALDEARAKLEAVTHIERSINDRGSSVPTNP